MSVQAYLSKVSHCGGIVFGDVGRLFAQVGLRPFVDVWIWGVVIGPVGHNASSVHAQHSAKAAA